MKGTARSVCLAIAILASSSVGLPLEAKEPQRKAIDLPGEYVRAILAVVEHRERDRSLSKTERDLSNFTVVVVEMDKKLLEVEFQPNPSDSDKIEYGGRTALGRQLVYGVRRADFGITYVHGFK